jgi:hypothetical protein
MRTKVVAVIAVIAVVVLGLVGYKVVTGARSAAASENVGASPSASIAPTTAPPTIAPTTPPPPPPPTFAAPADPSKVTVSGARKAGWALLHIDDGAVTGSANYTSVTNTVESMIKPWIASDYLRRLAEQGKTPSQTVFNEITLMLDDSNDSMAEKYFQLGGADAVVSRMVSICGLTHVTPLHNLWSWTEMTPQDTVRYGQCVLDGRAAGPQWTDFILETMKHVRGGVKDQISSLVQGGHWGIIDGVPANIAADMSIKNGFTLYMDGWHINCLAITPHWVLGVMLVIPTLQNGADACASVARQLVIDPAKQP